MAHAEARSDDREDAHHSASSPIHLKSLTTDHLPAFLSLRLDALRQHPEAFVPTWEEERSVDSVTMANRFRREWIGNGNFILGAWMHGELVGAIGIRRWSRAKQRHRASVWILFIQPDARGRGLGRYLLDAAIARCRNDGEIELLSLRVSMENTSARQLYATAGFRGYGVEPKAMRLDDRYIDIELMSLELDTNDAC